MGKWDVLHPCDIYVQVRRLSENEAVTRGAEG
jgi:hypothetical protein